MKINKENRSELEKMAMLKKEKKEKTAQEENESKLEQNNKTMEISRKHKEESDKKRERDKKKDTQDYDWKYITKLNDFGADSHTVLQNRDEYDPNNPSETMDRYDDAPLEKERSREDDEPELGR